MSEVAQTELVVTTPAAPSPSAPASAPEAPAAGGDKPAQTSAEQAPAAPEGGEQKPITDEQREKRTQSRRFERRLDKAYRERAAAEARAEVLAKEISQLKQAPADPAAPRLEQFKDIEEYASAKAKYESDKAVKEHTAKQRAEAQKQANQRMRQQWDERVERVADKYPDFDEVVGDISPSAPWAVAVMRADNGADVAYHLGKNLKEAERICGLDPISQFLAIGQLSAKLAAEPAKPKTPSKAPAPVSPLTGSSPAAMKSIYDPNISYEDFVKLRNKPQPSARKA